MSPRIGVQLFTFAGAARDGLEPVIRRIAAMGYDGVETAGLWNTDGAGLRRLLDDAGLVPIASHVGLPDDPSFDADLASHAPLGIDTVVTGILPEAFEDVQGIEEAAATFNAAAARAAARGMGLAYHNHWWELALLPDGRRAYEALFAALEPSVLAEVDVYWVQTGGADPAEVVRALGARARLLHVKDGPCVHGQPMTAVGEGVVDIDAVLDAAEHAEWWIVELDACATDVFEAVERSYEYLAARARS